MEGLKIFDAYPKTLEDFRIRTLCGGAVTAISCVIMFTLFFVELNYYLSPELSHQLTVDVNKDAKLLINLNVTFPKMACVMLSLDAVDVTGEQHFDISHEVFKTRLDLSGNRISTEQLDITKAPKTNKTDNEDKENEPEKPANDVAICGSCYGAESSELKCCNTCDDIKRAYKIKGWRLPDLTTIGVCKGAAGQGSGTATIPDEGCRFEGGVMVNKISGNLHITPGRSYEQSHAHVHDFSSFTNRDFNTTHVIDHLSFGKAYPGMSNALDGSHVVAGGTNIMYSYYVKLVPTSYIYLNGTRVSSNQYSVTRHEQVISIGPLANGLPGLFVHYEFSPIHVQLTHTPRSFGHFITALCSIVGGVFTVAGLIDAAIFNTSKLVQRKLEIGKQG